MCQLIPPPPPSSVLTVLRTQKRQQQQQLGCLQRHSFSFSKIFHPDGASGERKGGNTTAKEAAGKRAKGLLKRGRNFSPSSSTAFGVGVGRGRSQRKSPPPFSPFFSVFPAGATSLPPSAQPAQESQANGSTSNSAGWREEPPFSSCSHTLLSPPPLPPDREKKKRGPPPPHCWYAWERRRRRKLGGGRRRGGKLKRVAHFKLSLSHFIFSSLAPLSTFPPFPRER